MGKAQARRRIRLGYVTFSEAVAKMRRQRGELAALGRSSRGSSLSSCWLFSSSWPLPAWHVRFASWVQPIDATPSILLDWEVSDGGECTDVVHAETAGRALGAMEERSMCGGHRPSA